MQRVVAYRLERTDLQDDPERRAAAFAAVVGELERWLDRKGADDSTSSRGTFTSLSNGAPGSFRWEREAANGVEFASVTLEEDADRGQRMQTSISVADYDGTVTVYSALSSGSGRSTVSLSSPLLPYCPKVIRGILKLTSEWRHGPTRIEGLREARGAEMGAVVADQIRLATRTLPIVLISEDDGELLLGGLDSSLTKDLAGLASVWRVDEYAAWELTKQLGPAWACYYGAIRIFWPHFQADQPPPLHRRWAPHQLLEGPDDRGAANRIRTRLRSLVFRAAATNVLRPTAIDEARRSCQAARMHDLRAKLKTAGGGEYAELAEQYAKHNDALREREQELLDEASQLREELAGLSTDLENARAQLEYAPRPERKSDGDDRGDGEPDDNTGPAEGEIRFYKKHYSDPKRDHMLRVADCGHDKWEGAHSADKAKKGIIKLEQRSEFQALWHCARCEGGGVWKVKW